jgi:hypothetical protein
LGSAYIYIYIYKEEHCDVKRSVGKCFFKSWLNFNFQATYAIKYDFCIKRSVAM